MNLQFKMCPKDTVLSYVSQWQSWKPFLSHPSSRACLSRAAVLSTHLSSRRIINLNSCYLFPLTIITENYLILFPSCFTIYNIVYYSSRIIHFFITSCKKTEILWDQFWTLLNSIIASLTVCDGSHSLIRNQSSVHKTVAIVISLCSPLLERNPCFVFL